MPTPAVLDRLCEYERQQLYQVLSTPVQFIDHALFSKAATARRLFGDQTVGSWSTRPWCNDAECGRRLADTCVGRRDTLTTEQEVRLFLRFNYARSRIAKVLARFEGKRLTACAVSEVLWWHEQALAARAEIVQANMPLVLAMAKRSRLGNVDYMELISEGNMALLRSVDKFDCGRGFKFSTYACRAILKSFSRVAMRMSRYRGRFPTEFDPMLEKSNYQEERREEHEADCVDELRGIIKENAADLNETEVKVIQARFALCKIDGLEGEGPKTLEQVGMVIGVTKERVRQIQNRALYKLREKLQEDFLAV
ncbi:MAG: sigma-70 family RNA polymerase sigma factor [Phycisphaerae bacterium]|nr:sigma-70 family RNA polymerase sigma factor [Phycisphaerae bacterium]